MALVLLGEEVLDALVVAPLDVLADLVAHKVELAAGVGHLVESERAQTGELTPLVARHAGDERALAVDDLVVGKRQHEVLVELVHRGEREHAVVARAPREVSLHVVQGVVHPAHVPLEVEAQSAVLGRIGHERPGSGLLGDHHDVGVELAHGGVRLADEGRGVEVLLGTELVEALLAGVVDAEVHVEHRADAVHADAVDVEGLDPVEGVGHEEAANLPAGEVELVGAPVGVDLVLIEHLAVEGREAVSVGAEAAGNPVHDHADAGLVAGVDEVHELLRVAEARGRRKVAGGLIAPGAVERVLREGQNLDVRVAHLLHVGDELLREVVVGVEGAALRGEGVAGAGPGAVLARLSLRLVAVALPAAKMHFKDVERALEHRALSALRHPLLVLPGIARDVGSAGGGSRGQLGKEGIRIGLVELLAVVRDEEELIELARNDAGNETFPHVAGLGLGEGARGLVPIVEVADHVDRLHVRGPHGEVIARGSGRRLGRVGAELLVAAEPVAVSEQIYIVITEIKAAIEGVHRTLLSLIPCRGPNAPQLPSRFDT